MIFKKISFGSFSKSGHYGIIGKLAYAQKCEINVTNNIENMLKKYDFWRTAPKPSDPCETSQQKYKKKR